MRSLRWLQHTCTLAFVLSVASAAANAQGTSGTAPDSVARRFVSTLLAGDFAANAAMMDTSALGGIRRFVRVLGARDTSGEFLTKLIGVSSVAALDSLSDTQVYARFLSSVLDSQAELRDVMRKSTFKVIGHVDESPDLTHVVYRLTMNIDGVEMRKMDVVTLHREGATWRPILTTDIENLVARMSAGRS